MGINLYWIGDSGDWNDTAHWSTSSGGAGGAGPPGSTDNVIFDANSITVDGAIITTGALTSGSFKCASFFASTLAHTMEITIDANSNIGLAVDLEVLNGFVGSNKLTITTSNPGGQLGNLYLTGTIDSQSTTFNVVSIVFGGSTLSSNLTNFSKGSVTVGSYRNSVTPDFDARFYNLTAGQIVFDGHVSPAPVISMGTGIWTAKPVTGAYFTVSEVIKQTNSSKTLNGDTSTLVIDLSSFDATSTDFEFMGGQTWNNVTIKGNGTSVNMRMIRANGSGNVTFNVFEFQNEPIAMVYQDGITYTTSAWNISGSFGKNNTLSSLNGGTPYTNHSGTVSVDYVDVSDSTAAGAAVKFVDTNGTDNGGNTNWLFRSIPSGPQGFQNSFLSFADTNGDVQALEGGTTDNGVPIPFELETQDIDFGNRFHRKKIADRIAGFARAAIDSVLFAKNETGDYVPVIEDMSGRINISQNLNLEGFKFQFKWSGQSSGRPPEFEGIYIENISDTGMTYG